MTLAQRKQMNGKKKIEQVVMVKKWKIQKKKHTRGSRRRCILSLFIYLGPLPLLLPLLLLLFW